MTGGVVVVRSISPGWRCYHRALIKSAGSLLKRGPQPLTLEKTRNPTPQNAHFFSKMWVDFQIILQIPSRDSELRFTDSPLV